MVKTTEQIKETKNTKQTPLGRQKMFLKTL